MDERATRATLRRYDRLAGLYARMDAMGEHRGMGPWRRRLWDAVEGPRILEVGAGTGANFPFYPTGAEIVAIDLSPAMLARARAAASRLGVSVDLQLMDVQQLDFGDADFDAVVTSCVFCSVPDPISGFRELRRVLRPDGHAYLLEHVLSRRAGLRQAMRAVNPLVVRLLGANINRETRRNLEIAGFVVEAETDLLLDVVKLFVVRPRA